MISLNLSEYFAQSAEVKMRFIKEKQKLLERAIMVILDALRARHKLLICGNGGSAADAQHFAAELVCRFEKQRRALPAIALTTDTSVLTAWSNDYSFETVFSRQVEALGQKGDILIAISTSGNSMNVIRAVERAKEIGIFSIGLLGKDGGKLKDLVELALIVPSHRTCHIQECHMAIYHIICAAVEEKVLF